MRFRSMCFLVINEEKEDIRTVLKDLRSNTKKSVSFCLVAKENMLYVTWMKFDFIEQLLD